MGYIRSCCGVAFFLCDLSLFAGLGGGRQGEPSVATAPVADSGKSEGADNEGGFLIGMVGSVCCTRLA